ncbi:hypothetical protein ACFOWB_02495 [Chenggangzhangella methanolivorans]|uniref:hypothetical protein n=1 Tax=Chenggangzhangella methanolivorans TaxID=1437009 RepID=UPI0036237E94
MSASILPFRPRSSAPMSQVLPLPRVDVCGHHPDGRPDLIVFDVEYVRHDGPDGFDVLGTFNNAFEAEAFADRWMAANPDMGGGR